MINTNAEQLFFPIIYLAICLGILSIGIILFSFVSFFSKDKLHYSILLLGILGFIFVSSEMLVIILSWMDKSKIGVQFHRIEALSASLFLFALPFMIHNLLNFSKKLKSINKIIYFSGLLIAIITILFAFIYPDCFLSIDVGKKVLTTPWNSSRGTPGIIYKIRDIFLALIIIYSIFILIFNLITDRKNFNYLVFTFIGILIATITAIIDLSYASSEISAGLYTTRVYSKFSIGITFFILFSMISVIKKFINQSKDIEKAIRIESLGIFAGGIAHDFNNLLTIIRGNISLLKINNNSDQKNKNVLDDTEKACIRAKNLTDQLLTFSHGGIPIKNTTSISNLIKEISNLVLSGSNIKININIYKELWYADIDSGQISQVFQNILINAIQSMPEGGIIKITAKNIINPLFIKNLSKNQGFLKISIIDSGTGIYKKNVDKIFEPYFTTKEKGRGLGLAISHSIIKKHDGHIEVISLPEVGTTFSIYLPASNKKIIKEKAKPKTKKDKIYNGKVLLLDDEEMILNITGKFLTLFGFDVEIAKNGEEAVEMFEKLFKSGTKYKFVLLDLTIPGGEGGEQVLKKLKVIDPEIKAIASSGYSNAPVMSDHLKYGFINILVKPYGIEELKKVINEIFS
jgi:signal transduction histidine kinase/ActR/RegA family two-component response regulator